MFQKKRHVVLPVPAVRGKDQAVSFNEGIIAVTAYDTLTGGHAAFTWSISTRKGRPAWTSSILQPDSKARTRWSPQAPGRPRRLPRGSGSSTSSTSTGNPRRWVRSTATRARACSINPSS